jgi:hypothetical protein
MPSELRISPAARVKTMRSQLFDLDNGSGTTIDDVLGYFNNAVRLIRARIVYADATTGTVAAANATLGTTLAGAELVAATAYGNAKAVGTQTAMTLVTTYVAPGSYIHCRHTGVASTQAGKAYVEVDYTLFDV